MIKERLEQTVRELEAEKERAVSTVKDRIVREKVAVYNAEIDNSRAKALQELDAELNAKVVALQEEYAKKKQSLIELGEQDKQKHTDTILSTELAVVTVEYDNSINKLKAIIAEIKE